jgi:phage terminase large subunit-like protein
VVIDHYRRHVLPGFIFYGQRSTGSKADRAQPLAALAEGGAVQLLRGPWNREFLDEIESFPFGGVHDDQVDAASLAASQLNWFFQSEPEDTETTVEQIVIADEGLPFRFRHW